MDKPRVNPLMWSDSPDGKWSQSQTGAGWEYLIRDMGNYFVMPFPWKPPERFPTLEAAKAAAQADYEARILAALEPVTVQDGPDWEGFGRDLLEQWPVGDVDGSELFEAALRNGLIREIPGGYDPEKHIDAECICPEPGDPWYEYAFGAQDDT